MSFSILRAAVLASVAALPLPAFADADPGSYLAARQAAKDNDFAAGARYYTESLISDPSNPLLLESAVTSFVALGQVNRAIPVAREMVNLEIASQVANLVLLADEADRGAWDDLLAALDAGRTVSPLVDGLARAWAMLGKDELADARMNRR